MLYSKADSEVFGVFGKLGEESTPCLLGDLAASACPVPEDVPGFVNLLAQLFAHLLGDETTGGNQADLAQLHAERLQELVDLRVRVQTAHHHLHSSALSSELAFVLILFLIFAAALLISRVLLSVVAPQRRHHLALKVEIIGLGCLSVAFFRDVSVLDVNALDQLQVGVLG